MALRMPLFLSLFLPLILFLFCANMLGKSWQDIACETFRRQSFLLHCWIPVTMQCCVFCSVFFVCVNFAASTWTWRNNQGSPTVNRRLALNFKYCARKGIELFLKAKWRPWQVWNSAQEPIKCMMEADSKLTATLFWLPKCLLCW